MLRRRLCIPSCRQSHTGRTSNPERKNSVRTITLQMERRSTQACWVPVLYQAAVITLPPSSNHIIIALTTWFPIPLPLYPAPVTTSPLPPPRIHYHYHLSQKHLRGKVARRAACWWTNWCRKTLASWRSYLLSSMSSRFEPFPSTYIHTYIHTYLLYIYFSYIHTSIHRYVCTYTNIHTLVIHTNMHTNTNYTLSYIYSYCTYIIVHYIHTYVCFIVISGRRQSRGPRSKLCPDHLVALHCRFESTSCGHENNVSGLHFEVLKLHHIPVYVPTLDF